jgi:hypothetical protein
MDEFSLRQLAWMKLLGCVKAETLGPPRSWQRHRLVDETARLCESRDA